MGAVLDRSELVRALDERRRSGQQIVFTNGCFDILHVGHVRYLEEARSLGDVLVVGVNTDASVRRLGKGSARPFNSEGERAEVLAALGVVGYVTLFDEDTPLELIRRVRPNTLVKGGDWQPNQIVGGDLVLAAGGTVRSLPFAEGYSTTGLVDRIRSSTD